MQHPNVHAAWSEWSEDQRLHLIAVYNNPLRFRTRRELFYNFIRHMQACPNVVLHVVELQYGDRPFEMQPEIGLRTRDLLWHKENLIQIAASKLAAARYIAYADGDLHFTRHDWALEAVHQLQVHEAVQLFSSYAHLGTDHKPLRLIPSFACTYVETHGSNRDAHIRACEGKAEYLDISGETKTKAAGALGAPGGGWAFRREAFEGFSGMLETCILGSADRYMALGFVGYGAEHQPDVLMHPSEYADIVLKWQAQAFEVVRGNIGYVDQFVTHGWHGDYRFRHYDTRWRILAEHGFNPNTDLMTGSYGLIGWARNKPALEAAVRAYFVSRNEDSTERFSDPLV